jgi:hypothetical protein
MDTESYYYACHIIKNMLDDEGDDQWRSLTMGVKD